MNSAVTPEQPYRDLSEAERQALQDDGVICVRGALGERWLETIADGMERIKASPGVIADILSMPEKGFTGDLFMWRKHKAFADLLFESPLARLAQQAMNSRVVKHWYDQLFLKAPGADVPTPWHHDLTFWPIRGSEIISIWIPVDPVDRASSGLEYIRGSHLWDNRYKAITPDYSEFMVNPELEDAPDIEANREAYDLLSWDMQPGDILIFHPLIVHGSGGNQSTTRHRRALASRWVGEDVFYDPRPHTMPLPPGHGLEAGERLHGHLFPTVLGSDNQV